MTRSRFLRISHARIDAGTAERCSARDPRGRERMLGRHERAALGGAGRLRHSGLAASRFAFWWTARSGRVGLEHDDTHDRSERLEDLRLRGELDLFPGALDL